jgi:lipopolysaccharide biosynthesis regulator YciM
MPDPYWFAVALVPLAAVSGWWLAARRYRKDGRRQRDAVSSRYFRGLNYLLDEQPDKAIEVFVKLAEVNPETVETHLALGNLFRRRGEVDKAIHYHRHIMARSSLSEEHRTRALLELGEDYMRAGLLDRAERLFSKLTEDGRHSELAVRNLLAIYQQEKDWARAIVQARLLGRIANVDCGALIAQFHCEMAEAAWSDDERVNARGHLDSARRHHRDCVRAVLLEAGFDLTERRWGPAARAYQRACELDPEIIVLVEDDLVRCFSELERRDDLLAWLEGLIERSSTLSPALAFATIQAHLDAQRAIQFLLEQLEARPTARGLFQLLELMKQHGHDIGEIDPDLLRDLMRRLLAEQPRFRCGQCGFSGHTWHWQCPGCRLWETTRPVVGVLGE